MPGAFPVATGAEGETYASSWPPLRCCAFASIILVNNANATTGSSVSWLQTLFIIQAAITGSGSRVPSLPSISATS